MNAKKLFWYLPTLVIASVITITACKKKDTVNYTNVPTDQENKDYGSENARFDKIFIDADNMSDQAFTLISNTTLKGIALGSECAMINVDTAAKKITISFGTVNCLCKDGRYRRGSVVVNYTGNYTDSGTFHVITFKDYYVNNYKVEGTRTVTYKGRNSLQQKYWAVDMSGSVTSPDGKSVTTGSGSYTRIYISGEWTPNYVDDDEYSYAGYGIFTAGSGVQYNVKTDLPLYVHVNCAWINMGVMEIIPIGGVARLLDYGKGQCDDKSELTVNNVYSALKMD
jgi:hypothetical protein